MARALRDGLTLLDPVSATAFNGRGLEIPPTGRLGVGSKRVANRRLLAVMDEYGHDTTMAPHPGRNKIVEIIPRPGSATPDVWGIAAPTTAGTVTARTPALGSAVSRLTRLGFVSPSGSAQQLAEMRSNTAFHGGGTGTISDNGGFSLLIRFTIGDTVTGARFFCGMTASATAAATNVDPPTLVNSLGVAQISGDATQFYYIGAGSTAQSAVPCGAAVGAPTNTATEFELAIWSPPGLNATYFMQLSNPLTNVIASTAVVSGAATVSPAATVGLGYKLFRTNNNSTGAVTFDLVSLYLETDN